MCLKRFPSFSDPGNELISISDVFIPSTDSYILVNHSMKKVVVGYRGTAEPMAAVTDLETVMAMLAAAGDAHVHSGFLQSYLVTAQNTTLTTKSLLQRYPGYGLVFTGHSFGGAQAALAAADWTVRNYHGLNDDSTSDQPWWSQVQPELYTFGQPRIGNLAFASWFASLPITVYRVVQRSDVVPRLWMPGMFHHVREFWIDGQTGVSCGPREGDVWQTGETADCVNAVPLYHLNVADHSDYFGILDVMEIKYIIKNLILGSLPLHQNLAQQEEELHRAWQVRKEAVIKRINSSAAATWALFRTPTPIPIPILV
ncbi:alpha/beta-hydrolase [Ramicandelaber brevisporus]|nr:alpha/beta-hydrolase [Ramicandelaber brevisporus]